MKKICIFLIFLNYTIQAQITKTINLPEPLIVSNITHNSDTFCRIESYMPNPEGIPGYPDLPVNLVSILLPEGKDAISIQYNIIESNE